MIDQLAGEPGVFTMAELVHGLRMFRAGFQMTGEGWSGDRRGGLFGSRKVIIRGVEMFLGWVPEDASDGGCSPLRRITHLCGLTLGGEDAPDDWTMGGDAFSQERQKVQGIRLAAVDGELVDVEDGAVGRVGNDQGFDDQREAGR